MKVIKLKLTKKGYFDLYVEATLALIFDLTKTEEKVVSLMLYYIDEEVSNGVPLEAAIRLVSMYEYRIKIRDSIDIKSRKDKKVTKMPEASFNNIMSSLRGTPLIDKDNKFNSAYVIRHSDGGFKYIIDEKEEDV